MNDFYFLLELYIVIHHGNLNIVLSVKRKGYMLFHFLPPKILLKTVLTYLGIEPLFLGGKEKYEQISLLIIINN